MEIQNKSMKYNPLYKKIYTVWHSMMQRCYQEKCGSYHNYGKIGVTVSDEWQTIDGFIKTIDLVQGYDEVLLLSGQLQLDKDIKISGNKIYSYDRCMFVSPQENYSNRRNNTFFVAIHLDDEKVFYTNNRELFCREHDIDTSTVWRMLQKQHGRKQNKHAPNIYKGFVFFYPEDFANYVFPKKTIFKGTEIKTKKEVLFENQSQFAREYDLNNNLIVACLKGRQHKTGGWTFSIHEIVDYKDSTTIERQLSNFGLISETK